MTTVALRSSLGGLAEAILQLGSSKSAHSNNEFKTINNNNNNNNKRTLSGSSNNNKHVHFQLDETASSDEEDEEDDNEKENNRHMIHHQHQERSSGNSNKRQRKTIFIYVTSGVKGGLAGKKALMAKFRHAVQIDSRSVDLVLPDWKDVPSPIDITCGVSDDLEEKHTRALMAQGVLMVKSSWLLHCITEKRLLVPIHEDRFALRPNHPVWTKEQTRAPLIRVTETLYYSSTTTNGSVDQHIPTWKHYQDDVVRAIHQAKVRGHFDRAKQFENLLKSSGKTEEEIQTREKYLYGWSADLLKF